MKVRSAVRRLCRECRVVKRRGIVYVRCKANARHKQRQGFATSPTLGFSPTSNQGVMHASGAPPLAAGTRRPRATFGMSLDFLLRPLYRM